jgi:5-methylcytosine-specific restriction endonuclease McrA
MREPQRACLTCNRPFYPTRTRRSRCETCHRAHERQRRPSGVRHAWARDVKRRDGCCVLCGSTDRLEADHIIPLAWGGSPYSLSNGRALCHRCHVAEHRRRAAEAKRNGW